MQKTRSNAKQTMQNLVFSFQCQSSTTGSDGDRKQHYPRLMFSFSYGDRVASILFKILELTHRVISVADSGANLPHAALMVVFWRPLKHRPARHAEMPERSGRELMVWHIFLPILSTLSKRCCNGRGRLGYMRHWIEFPT